MSSKKGKQEVCFHMLTSSSDEEAFTAIAPSIENEVEGKNTQRKVNEPGFSPTSLIFSVMLLSREWIIPVLNNP